ncbi:MAG: bifunctional [glutamate--ammonia ligase]-adenylyl-L-tyrosine phosphorylase/[glutamate--ammonia-ligase] adenylyltransferase [Proteobacteria bacterium]|nr:bifunctional [glutamate--ammonia ligase]-adenylyl-L-tyrosine phosphorylase/[glutamate--ammonia-ligase] adenylyltransferase [Pseudomonadota bacterium]
MKPELSNHHLLQEDLYHWEQLESLLLSEHSRFSADFLTKIKQLAISSSYALSQLRRDPALLETLQSLTQFSLDETKFPAAINQIESLDRIKSQLRQFRHQKLIEIIYLDVIEKLPLDKTLSHLSALADLLIQSALSASEKHLAAKHGQPLDQDGNPLQLNIIAMGKLGGCELNFSSDIDLICCYAGDGELTGFGRLSHQDYFTRVVRLFTQLLNEKTEEGFVYRVDLRLRPWGDSGPVVLSHAALEHYYQLHGREWEQYAMVKARVLTGSDRDREFLAAMLKPFVYRKYHDYRVFEGLAALKDKIDQQGRSKNMQDNIKLGPGGIREIEFFVQAFQILKGGRNKQLQTSRIFRCFDVLEKQKIVAGETIRDLREAYVFLRRLENKFQMLADQQTHSCPNNEIAQGRIAQSMGFPDWATVYTQQRSHREAVSNHFRDLFKRDVEDNEQAIFSDAPADEKTESRQIEFMRSIGLRDIDEIDRRLSKFFNAKAWGFMSARAKQRFSALMPGLLKAVGQSDQQPVLFERLMRLFSSIAGRSVYFELLHQNSALLEKLVSLFDRSEWIAQEVTRYPMLLEQLIQAGDPDRRFDISMLQQNLQLQLDNVIGDAELELDVLRLFNREQTIVIAIAELSEQISTTEVSLHLSELAELLLQAVYELARKALEGQFGEPACVEDGETRTPELAIIGYGKLGSREIHYQSDLDVIFLHNSSGDKQHTLGLKCIDNSMYFAKLAQKIISMTSVLTGSGKLYEIDSRLRPDGASGLLVSSTHAYLQYQLNKAWTWEHQALVRARQVVGSTVLETEFDRIRKAILVMDREPEKLKRDIVEMRDKIHQNKKPAEGEVRNLKYSRGCLIDIEFMVQYWTLLYANKDGSICSYSDNIGLLKALFRLGLISRSQSQLIDIYQTYHRWLHETVLQNKPAEIDSETIAVQVAHVLDCWNECFSLEK